MKLGFFTFWDFAAISQQFRSCEMRVTVLRNGTRVPKVLSQPRNPLRNGTFVAKSAFFTSQCVSQLRNRCSCAAKWHSCAKNGFAAAKYPAEWSFPCEMEDFMLWWFAAAFAAAKWGPLCCEVALVCQIWFRSCEMPSQRLLQCCGMVWQQNADFAKAAKSRRPLFFPCFSLHLTPILLRFFFLQFLCNSS